MCVTLLFNKEKLFCKSIHETYMVHLAILQGFFLLSIFYAKIKYTMENFGVKNFPRIKDGNFGPRTTDIQ